MKSSSESLLTVINDILDFSKIEAGRFDLDPLHFNLRDHLEEAVKALALRAHEKGLELLLEVQPLFLRCGFVALHERRQLVVRP